MKQKSGPDKAPAEQVLKDIRRQTRRQYSTEEKIRIVLEGLRGEENISELCRREGRPNFAVMHKTAFFNDVVGCSPRR
jgi:transposase-like protein